MNIMLKLDDPTISAPELDENIPLDIRNICKGLLEKDENKRIGFEEII